MVNWVDRRLVYVIKLMGVIQELMECRLSIIRVLTTSVSCPHTTVASMMAMMMAMLAEEEGPAYLYR